MEEYLRTHPQSDATKKIVEEGMRSSLTCPLIALGKPIGFMFFSSMKPGTYENVHVELFTRIAGQLALCAEKSILYGRLIELNDLKNKFLGMAVHDLRSPLAVIKNYAEIFECGLAERNQGFVEKSFNVIRNQCVKMLNLINDLLSISAIESGQLALRLQSVNLSEYLKNCYELNLPTVKAKRMELKLIAETGDLRVSMDPERMEQVINNLISNAVKFSHPGTEIILKAAVVEGEVHVSVTDRGQGIPDEELPKIFAYFSRTKVKPTAGETSTGLGLAIVQRIVEAHGGKIWVHSKPGEGSTFTFSLPLEESKK